MRTFAEILKTGLLVASVSVVALVLCGEVRIADIMESEKIVPDVVDTAPAEVLEVIYPGGVKVQLGNELTPTQVKDQPKVTWKADSDALYTLLMSDPDAPSRQNPALGEVRHWLVVNIPGCDVDKGQTLYEYIGSGPPEGSGLHRYVFLVFKQPTRIISDVFVSKNSRDGRIKTKTRDLIAKNGFGPAEAGNFYQAQYDDYVPILHQQLGGAPPKVD